MCRSIHRRARVASVSAALLLPLMLITGAHAAPPLPQGGHFISGSGNIAQSGANMNITQTGVRGIIEWNAFSIAPGHTVSIDNGAGATLNRVTGSDVSALYGTLKGSGSVYLINPHGVLIGPNGVVSTGGRFLASTLDMSNDDFNNQSFETVLTGNSNADVVNLGKIGSSNGDVFLISAHKVTNAGSIAAPNGSAELATGRQVTMIASDSLHIGVLLGSGGTVTNTGAVQAAIISLLAADGNIYALAGRSSVLRATGTATRDGHVWLVADTGTVDTNGATIIARHADGTRADVDTQGKTVRLANTTVDADNWTITAGDFTADAATADTLSANLSRGASITVNAIGPDGKFGATGTGDIAVQSNVRWTGATSLTLNASHSLSIAPRVSIANVGSGSLVLAADTSGFDNSGSVINRGTIDWSKSGGIVPAFCDMNGGYARGIVRTNPSWQPARFSGVLTQFTAYELVNSIYDMRAMKSDLAGVYALGRSLELAGANDVADIGTSAKPFTGQFFGNGHLLGDLDMSSGADAGLFGVIGRGGIVRDFTLAGFSATTSAATAGLLAGTNDGRVVNVGATGALKSTGNANTIAGGLVGENRGCIEQSWASVNIDGAATMGGLAGQNDGRIVQSYATGFGTSRGTNGGLVGANNGAIVQSYANERLTGGAVIGGLVGSNAGRIRESYADSTLMLDAGSKAGGLAGVNRGRIASNVFWNRESSGATAGVGSGTAMRASSGLTDAQMTLPSSFGPSWDFGAQGVWSIPEGYLAPVLRWSGAF
jgi:filamentous hemagglutinin family protein